MNNITSFIISTAVLIAAAVALLIFEKKTKWEGGDERQLLEAMKSSTIGFYVLILLSLISYLAIRTFELPFKSEILIVASVAVSLTVVFARQIWLENLWSNIVNPKIEWLCVFVVICFLDYRFIKAYINDKAIENLMIAICFSACFLVCVITFIIRKVVKSNKDASEAE